MFGKGWSTMLILSFAVPKLNHLGEAWSQQKWQTPIGHNTVLFKHYTQKSKDQDLA